MKKFSLKAKLTMSIVGVILVFGMMATVAVYYFAQETLLTSEQVDLETMTVEKASQVGYIFGIGSSLAETIGSRDLVLDYFGDVMTEQDEETLEFLEGYNVDDGFSAIYLMDAEGDTWVSTNELFVGKNYSFRNYFQHAIEGEPFLDVAVGVTSGELGYYLAHPVENAGGEILGVVVLKMKPVTVDENIRFTALSEDANMMLVDEFGVVIFSNDESRIYKSLGELSDDDQEELEELRRYEGLEIQPLDYGEIYRELNYVDDVASYEVFDELEGKLEMVSVAPVIGTDFYLVIEEDLAGHIAPALRIASILSLFVFLAAMFAALLIVYIVFRFLSPLKKVEVFAQKMAAGDLTQRLVIATGDEIQELAENLNVMAKGLQDSYANIEGKVKERTAELEKTTKYMHDREIKMIDLKNELNKLKGAKGANDLTKGTDEN